MPHISECRSLARTRFSKYLLNVCFNFSTEYLRFFSYFGSKSQNHLFYASRSDFVENTRRQQSSNSCHHEDRIAIFVLNRHRAELSESEGRVFREWRLKKYKYCSDRNADMNCLTASVLCITKYWLRSLFTASSPSQISPRLPDTAPNSRFSPPARRPALAHPMLPPLSR